MSRGYLLFYNAVRDVPVWIHIHSFDAALQHGSFVFWTADTYFHVQIFRLVFVYGIKRCSSQIDPNILVVCGERGSPTAPFDIDDGFAARFRILCLQVMVCQLTV